MDRSKLGPFFLIENKLLYNAADISDCDTRGDKIDNPCSHEKLFEENYSKSLDYIDYPRGRVIWDSTNGRAIIYIDPCINNAATIGKIAKAFSISDYTVEGDIHYHCKKCSDCIFDSEDGKGNLFDEWNDMYFSFNDQEVDCDSLENLIFRTYKSMRLTDHEKAKMLDKYEFIVPMAEILGMDSCSNIGELRTEIYCDIIKALINSFFHGFTSEDDSLIVDFYCGRMKIDMSSGEEFRNGLKEMGRTMVTVDPESRCPLAEECSSEECFKCEKWWEII